MKPQHIPKTLAIAAALLAVDLFTPSAQAVITIVSSGSTSNTQVSLDDVAYTQNFDSLSSSGGTFVNAQTNTWTNNSTLAGWYIASTGTLNTTTLISNGSSNPGTTGGRVFSYGDDNSSERALGVNGNNATNTNFIGLGAMNSSGQTLTSFTIGYTGEQWRESSNSRQNSLTLQYKVGASLGDLTAASGWTTISGGNFASSTTAASANGFIYSSTLGGFTIEETILDGQSIWFRWVQQLTVTNTTNDQLAIDDVNLSFTAAIPEPSTYALCFGLAGLGLAWAFRRERDK